MVTKNTRFIGKSRIGILQDILKKLQSDPSSEKYFFIIGENGYGMSRFGKEIKASLNNPFFIHHTFTTFYENTPLAGIFNIINAFIAILEKYPDIKYQVGQKIQKELGNANRSLLDVFPQLGVFMSKSEKKGDFNTSLIKLFQIFSSSTGLILFLDDLHYCDKSSLAFFNSMSGKKIPLTLIITFRKSASEKIEFYYREVMRKCDNLKNYELGLLDKEDTGLLVNDWFENQIETPETLVDILSGKISVSPLLLTETLKQLIDDEFILKKDNWKYNPGILQQLNLPKSFQELLFLRLGKFSAEEQEIIRYCAAIGRSFDGNLLESISFKNPDLFDFDIIYSTLEKAMAAGILESIEGGLYSFTSITVRNELYNSMESESRAAFHLICAEYFEKSFSAEDSIIFELAYHYSRSDDLLKGITYLLKAAEKSRLIYSKESAIEYCEQALNTLRFARDIANSDELKVKIVFEYLASLRVMGNFTKGLELLKEIQDIVEKSGNKSDLAYLYYWFGEMHYLLGQQMPAINWYNRCIPVAEEAKLTWLLALPYQVIAGAFIFVGNFRGTIDYVNKSLLYAEKNDFVNIARANGFYGWAYGFMGDGKKALYYVDLCEKALANIEEEEQMIGNYHLIGALYGLLGYLDKCLDWENRAIALAEKINNPIMSYSAFYSIGMAYSRKGQYHEAIRRCSKAVSFATEKEIKIGLHLPLEVLGFSYLQLGQWAEAIENSEKALAVTLQLNNFYSSSENARNIGAAYYRRENPDFVKAEEYLTRSVQYAEKDNYPHTLTLAYAEYAGFLAQSGKTEETKLTVDKCRNALKDLSNPSTIEMVNAILSGIPLSSNEPAAEAECAEEIPDNKTFDSQTVTGITLVKEEVAVSEPVPLQPARPIKPAIPDGVYALSSFVDQIIDMVSAENLAVCISRFFTPVLHYTGFERGFFYVIQDARLECIGGRDHNGNDIALDIPNVCKQAMRNAALKSQSIYIRNAIEDENYKLFQSVHSRKIKSIYVSLAQYKNLSTIVYLENLNGIQEMDSKEREIIKHYQNIVGSLVHRLPNR